MASLKATLSAVQRLMARAREALAARGALHGAPIFRDPLTVPNAACALT